MMLLRLLLITFAAMGLMACSPAPVKSLTAQGYQAEADDIRLRGQADEMAKAIDRSRFRYEDEDIEAYLQALSQRVLKDVSLPDDIRIRVNVIEDTDYNAFALPNGTIYFHTGLLSLIDQEDELATVIAHELGHVIHRDSVKSDRQQKSAANLYAGLSPFPLINILATYQFVGSVTGYSRDLERAADLYAAERLQAAGYSLEGGVRFFQRMEAANDEAAGGQEAPYFFSSHPRMQERVESFRKLHAELALQSDQLLPPIRKEPARLFEEITLKTLSAYVDRGEIKKAGFLLNRGTLDKNRPELLLLEARLALLKGDTDEARRLLEKTLSTDKIPQAHRELANLHYKAEDWDAAAEHFRQYLALKPDAEDRSFIEYYLEQIQSRKEND